MSSRLLKGRERNIFLSCGGKRHNRDRSGSLKSLQPHCVNVEQVNQNSQEIGSDKWNVLVKWLGLPPHTRLKCDH